MPRRGEDYSQAWPTCLCGGVPRTPQQSPSQRLLALPHIHQECSHLRALHGLFPLPALLFPRTHTLSVNSLPSSLCSNFTFLMRLLPCIKSGWLSIAVGHTTPDIAGAKLHHCMRLMEPVGQRLGQGSPGDGFFLLPSLLPSEAQMARDENHLKQG